MDHAHELYYDRVIGAIQRVPVIGLFFPRIGRSLILDLRRDGATGPAVLVDVMVASAEERMASFARLRPTLPLPERLTLAPWPGPIRELEDSGVLEAIIERCRADGGEPLVEEARAAYRALQGLERAALRALVQGRGLRTIWQREPSG